MSDSVKIPRAKPCDFCKAYADEMNEQYGVIVNIAPAEFDAKTKQGSWANMCSEHFLEQGLGKLGTGYGQRLIVEDPHHTEPERKANSILEEREDGTYYTGPLEPAMKALCDEYGDHLTVGCNEDGTWHVIETRGSTDGSPNQWGRGQTEEEAWRYLIGADFGPLDATYEDEGYEAHQRKMLGLD